MEVAIKNLQDTKYRSFYLESKPDVIYDLVEFDKGYYMSLATTGPFAGEVVKFPPEFRVITVYR